MNDLLNDKRQVQVVYWLKPDKKWNETSIDSQDNKSIKYWGMKWVFNWVVGYVIMSNSKGSERLNERKTTSRTTRQLNLKKIDWKGMLKIVHPFLMLSKLFPMAQADGAGSLNSIICKTV